VTLLEFDFSVRLHRPFVDPAEQHAVEIERPDAVVALLKDVMLL
jgi:hypothetical protein